MYLHCRNIAQIFCMGDKYILTNNNFIRVFLHDVKIHGYYNNYGLVMVVLL